MKKIKKKIGIIGLGYIGLPLTAAFARVGFNVLGIDINEEKIKKLKKSYKADIHEPGLNAALKRYSKRIDFSSNQPWAIGESDVLVITVGTPISDKGKPDYRDIRKVTEVLGRNLRKGHLVILKSTVLPTITRSVAKRLEKLSGLTAGRDFYVAFCPERTLEGRAIKELHSLPKIIGGINKESLDKGARIMKQLGGRVIKVSSLEVAEMAKCIDNSYRLANIAFANEVGDICQKIGIDGYEIVLAVNNAYPRTNLFLPGLGAGGPCLSKDPQILNYYARQNKVNPRVIEASLAKSLESNRKVSLISSQFIKKNRIKRPKVSLVGLAFKGLPETDDLRGAPSVDVYNSLKKDFPNITFSFYDPIIKNFLGNKVSKSLENCLKGSNAVLFLTNHPSLKEIEAGCLLKKCSKPLLIIDCWHNLKNLEKVQEKEVQVFRIGEPLKTI